MFIENSIINRFDPDWGRIHLIIFFYKHMTSLRSLNVGLDLISKTTHQTETQQS